MAGVAGQPQAAPPSCSTHRLPNNLGMLRRDLEQGSRRAAGLDGSALPFADGAEGDAQHAGEAFLGDIDLPADLGRPRSSLSMSGLAPPGGFPDGSPPASPFHPLAWSLSTRVPARSPPAPWRGLHVRGLRYRAFSCLLAGYVFEAFRSQSPCGADDAYQLPFRICGGAE